MSRITLAVLRTGFAGGWVSARQVIQVELARYMCGETIVGIEELLALLLSDELKIVVQILARNERSEFGSSPL